MVRVEWKLINADATFNSLQSLRLIKSTVFATNVWLTFEKKSLPVSVKIRKSYLELRWKLAAS